MTGSQARIRDRFTKVWHVALQRAGVPYFRIYDLRSTYARRLSAGGVADEWVTQLLRQGDAQVFKRYSQMKREALQKMNRMANEGQLDFGTERPNLMGLVTVLPRSRRLLNSFTSSRSAMSLEVV